MARRAREDEQAIKVGGYDLKINIYADDNVLLTSLNHLESVWL